MRLTRGWAVLSAAGLIGEAVYLMAAIRLPWWRYGSRLWSWPELLGGGKGLPVCLAAIGALMGAYLVGWFAVRQGWGHRRIVWGFAGLFTVTLFWVMPISSDLFTYLTQAHVFADLQANPFQVAPLTFFTDPLIRAYPTRYVTRPSVYGPAWVLLAAPGVLTRWDIVGGVCWIKGLAAAAYLGSARLVELILQQTRPIAAAEGLYLFAWNPLILLLAVGAGHNDLVMMALVLLALWSAQKQHWSWAWVSLALSVWVKYVSAILVPLLILWTWKQRDQTGWSRGWRRVAGGLSASALLSTMVLAPFWFPGMLTGIGARLLQPINWMEGWSDAGGWMLRIGLAFFVGAYAVLMGNLARGEASFQRLANACFLAFLLLFGLGAARSQPWHLIWSVALAGLSDWRWAWPVSVGLTAMMLGAQTWAEWGAPGLNLLF